MAIELNDNIKVLAPKPIDSRYFKPNNVPWVSVIEVNLTIPSVERHQGLTVNIAGVEYWYKNGINNLDLETKNVSSGTVTSVTGTDGVTVATGTTTPVIGLGNITPLSTNGVLAATMAFVDATSSIQNQLNLKAPINNPTFTGTVSGVTSTMVGLGNVDNTTDANKPVSTATQTALNLKAPIASPAFTGKVSLTGSNSSVLPTKSLLNLTQTWDTSVPATPIKLTITDSLVEPANNGTKLIELIVGSTTMFSVDKIGNLFVFGNSTSSGSVQQDIWAVASGNKFSTIRFKNSSGSTEVTKGLVIDNAGTDNKVSNPSGTFDLISSDSNFTPVSGNCQFSFLKIGNTINQTGGANGIIRGLYVNPTVTNAADFRAIDVLKGSIVLPYRDETATYAIKTSDYLVNITSGTVTATLPTAVGCQGKHYIIKNSGASSLTLATTSSETIDGSTTLNLNTIYKYVHVVSTGASWIIIANN